MWNLSIESKNISISTNTQIRLCQKLILNKNYSLFSDIILQLQVLSNLFNFWSPIFLVYQLVPIFYQKPLFKVLKHVFHTKFTQTIHRYKSAILFSLRSKLKKKKNHLNIIWQHIFGQSYYGTIVFCRFPCEHREIYR